MYTHVAEYVKSLASIAGKRWLEGQAALQLLTPEDLRVVLAVKDGTAKNDLALARLLYGKAAKVDGRYRQRITRVMHALSNVVLTCTLAAGLDDRRRNAIMCLRHLCVGEALLRTHGPKASRLHLLKAVQHITAPELVWYAPPVHFALAYYDAVNERGPLARLGIENAMAAVRHALIVSDLQQWWLRLSIPLYRKSDLAKQPALILQARDLLTRTARKPITSLIGVAASRLANTISQVTQDVTIGIRWLERSRSALIHEGAFTPSKEREYHSHRLFLYETTDDYVNGIQEALTIAKLSEDNAVHWFPATLVVQRLQLRHSQYIAALHTTKMLMAHREFVKQPAYTTSRIRLNGLYASVLSRSTLPSLRALAAVRAYTLDSIVLRLLIAQQQHAATIASDAMHAIRRYVDRTEEPRSDRALWLLSRLLTSYAENDHSIRACRRSVTFKRLEAELSAFKNMTTNNTVVSPRVIWKAVISRR